MTVRICKRLRGNLNPEPSAGLAEKKGTAVFERKLPHESLDRAIAEAIRASKAPESSQQPAAWMTAPRFTPVTPESTEVR